MPLAPVLPLPNNVALTTQQRVLVLARDGRVPHAIAAELGLSINDVIATLTDPSHLPTEPSTGVGPPGPQGSPGPQGPPGPQGGPGVAGPVGQTGPTGLTGPPGAKGETGPKGETGVQGPTGTVGPPGEKGASGTPGEKGATGPPGATGTKGETGPQGAIGPTGQPGEKGATGLTGPAGEKGPQGATGPQGAIGPAPPLVTSLPGSPVDGQEVLYLADSTNGVVWHLRYRAASASAYKWEYVGGAGLAAENTANQRATVTANTATFFGSVCRFLLPLPGFYDFTAQSLVQAWGATGYPVHYMTIYFAGNSSGVGSYCNLLNVAGWRAWMTVIGRAAWAGPGGGLAELWHTSSQTEEMSVEQRRIHAVPVRVSA